MRKKIYIFLTVLLSCSGTTTAQQAAFDSLIQVAKVIVHSDPAAALLYCDSIEALIVEQQLHPQYYKLYMLRGDCYSTQQEHDKALFEYEQMDREFQTDEILRLQAGRISRYYRNIGDYPAALKYVQQSLKIGLQLKDSISLTAIYGDLSSIYHRLEQNDEALKYQRERIKIAKKVGYTKGEFLGYYNASQYTHLDSIEEKLFFLSKADSINSNFIKNKFYAQIILLNLAESLLAQKKYTAALAALEEISGDALNSKNSRVKLFFLHINSSVLSGLGRHNEAKSFAEQGLTLANATENLEYQEEFHSLLETNYVERKDYEQAYFSLQQKILVADSLVSADVLKETEDLKIKYETATKEKELVTAQVQVAQRTNQRNLSISGLLLLVGLTFYLWRRTIYKKRESVRQLQLQEQKIESLEKEKKILSLASMIEGQEEERKRIAQDLHDGLGGLLSSVKSHFAIIQSEIEKIENLTIYKKANHMIDEAVDEVRRISQNLMPSALRLHGLEAAAAQLIEELNHQHPIQFSFSSVGQSEGRLTDTQMVFIYRIFQETTTNIIKHAQAQEATIQLNIFAEEINILIEDDGKGFDAAQEYEGIGMKSLRSRVDHLHGVMEIDSRPNQGTSISINFPI